MVDHPRSSRPIDAKRQRAHENRQAMVRSATDLFTTSRLRRDHHGGRRRGRRACPSRASTSPSTRRPTCSRRPSTPRRRSRIRDPVETDPDRALAELVDECLSPAGDHRSPGPRGRGRRASGRSRRRGAPPVRGRPLQGGIGPRGEAPEQASARDRGDHPSGVRRGLRPAQPPAPRAAGARTRLVAEALRRMGRLTPSAERSGGDRAGHAGRTATASTSTSWSG